MCRHAYFCLLVCDECKGHLIFQRRVIYLRCACIKFKHYPHPLGYLCAIFCFFCRPHCWASPCSKMAYSITQSLTHPAYLMPQEAHTQPLWNDLSQFRTNPWHEEDDCKVSWLFLPFGHSGAQPWAPQCPSAGMSEINNVVLFSVNWASLKWLLNCSTVYIL